MFVTVIIIKLIKDILLTYRDGHHEVIIGDNIEVWNLKDHPSEEAFAIVSGW